MFDFRYIQGSPKFGLSTLEVVSNILSWAYFLHTSPYTRSNICKKRLLGSAVQVRASKSLYKLEHITMSYIKLCVFLGEGSTLGQNDPSK